MGVLKRIRNAFTKKKKQEPVTSNISPNYPIQTPPTPNGTEDSINNNNNNNNGTTDKLLIETYRKYIDAYNNSNLEEKKIIFGILIEKLEKKFGNRVIDNSQVVKWAVINPGKYPKTIETVLQWTWPGSKDRKITLEFLKDALISFIGFSGGKRKQRTTTRRQRK